MLAILLLGLCLLAGSLGAAHITDKLVVGLYERPELEGKPKRLLTSGTPIEVLQQKGKAVQVRLGDDTRGWIERRYVSEETPAAMLLLEARAEIRRLRRQLQERAGGKAKDDPAPALPSADQVRLGLQLGEAREKIRALEQQLAELPRLRAAAAERDRLLATREEILRLLQPVAEGDAPEGETGSQDAADGWPSGKWFWIGLAAALVLGLVVGAWLVDYRVRRRFGGIRI